MNSNRESPALSPAARPAAMRFILLTVLIDMVSIGLIIPVLPVLVGNFTANLAEQAFWFGAVMFTFAVANFFSSPILGALSDRYGRRPVLLVGFCGLAFSVLMTALATQPWMLVAIRPVSGALMSNTAVANAYVADITPSEERARRFGQLGAMLGMGFILDPAMGGLLGDINGQAVEKDEAEAYKWYVLAAGKGLAAAKTKVRELGKLLPPATIAAGKARAQAWKAEITATAPDPPE